MGVVCVSARGPFLCFGCVQPPTPPKPPSYYIYILVLTYRLNSAVFCKPMVLRYAVKLIGSACLSKVFGLHVVQSGAYDACAAETRCHVNACAAKCSACGANTVSHVAECSACAANTVPAQQKYGACANSVPVQQKCSACVANTVPAQQKYGACAANTVLVQ